MEIIGDVAEIGRHHHTPPEWLDARFTSSPGTARRVLLAIGGANIRVDVGDESGQFRIPPEREHEARNVGFPESSQFVRNHMNAVTISSSAVVFALTTLVAADSGVDGGGGAPTAVGTGFVIPDLTLGVTTSIVLSGDSFPGIVNPGMIVGLTINPEHTWVGDLIFSLSHNDGHDTVSADLFRRMGMTTAGSGFGNSNDLQGLYRFSDSFAIPFWSAPNITGNIVPGDYRPTTNLFNAAPGPVVSLGAVFANRTIAGTWTLTISDHGSGDFGTLESWALWLDVPVPGALTLLAIAGLTPSRRRRL